MKLREVLKGIDYELVKGSIDTNISDIKYDSRKVEDNDIFVSLVGINSDGHDYIDKAIELGCNTVIVEKDINIDKNINIIKVNDTRKVLSLMSINYFNNPKEDIVLIGITGTKGKTTTSWMIKNILEEDNKKCGIIGTMGIYFNNKHYETVNTTPESYEIQKYLREMVNDGVKYCVMEVSSQALKVGRVEGLTFDYGIFTNLTKDHIGEGEHSSMEEYVYCKSLLFSKCKCGIFNIDDSYSSVMIDKCTGSIYRFGYDNTSDIVIKNVKLFKNNNFLGIKVNTTGIIEDTFLINTPGIFSAYNAVSSIMVCYLIGCTIDSMKKALSKITIKGRMEIVPVNKNYMIIIDYAHNGASMESALKTIKGYHPNRIISVFGAGGNRSRDRRFEMGEMSGKYADFTIITEDNSRFESVMDIMNDIEIGIKKTNGKYIKIEDRNKAIKYAIDMAEENDVIMLLGKGHETYKDVNGVKEYYDEREVVNRIIG